MPLAVAYGGGSGGGGVTSVGLSAPAEFSVTGSPVTGAGTLALAWASGAANRVLATPDGSTGVPVFRALVANDIPSLDASKIGSGVFDVARIPALPYALTSHTHAAADITSGVLDNGRVNWASPNAIGTGTPETGTFTRVFIANPLPLTPDNSSIEFATDSSQTLLRWRSTWVAGSLRRNSNDIELWSQNGGVTLQTAAGATLTFSGRFTPSRQALETNQSVVWLQQTSGLTNTRATFGLSHRSSGTPSAGFGQNIEFLLKSSTTNDVQAARLAAVWNVATHASRVADLVASAIDFAAEREIWRGRANGTAAAIGFLGAAPVPRQTLPAAATDLASAITLVNALRDLAILVGLGQA